MNHIANSEALPKDVTYFIGPVGAPENIREAYLNAVRAHEAGNAEPLDQFIDLQINTLRQWAEGDNPSKDPPLKQLMETLIDEEIRDYSTFVGKGYMKRTWVPTVYLYLDRMATRSGSPLTHVFTKRESRVIAATLGQAFKAEWIYTSWAYPVRDGETV